MQPLDVGCFQLINIFIRLLSIRLFAICNFYMERGFRYPIIIHVAVIPTKKKVELILEVESDDDDDVAGTEYETLHPELRHWDNGRSSMLSVLLYYVYYHQFDPK
jgi:hypothetical protein